MSLFLHSPNAKNSLADVYREAFADAVELFVVSAYLTDWDKALALGKKLRKFRIVIGKDFGITRKDACRKVLAWLPPSRRAQFLVADDIQGFHPKAVFWLSTRGTAHALVGSSNLTRAAFCKNYEANLKTEISMEEFSQVKDWIFELERRSVAVSEDWIKQYVEGSSAPQPNVKRTADSKDLSGAPAVVLSLEVPENAAELLARRRQLVSNYNSSKEAILALFRRCASGKIASSTFFDLLPTVWGGGNMNRLQGKGWERSGKAADFRALCKAFLMVYAASAADRDDVVAAVLDNLAKEKNPARGAFLSEMLCLAFPENYPVLNDPVFAYLKAMRFKAPRGASEGAQYLDLAMKLRSFLRQNPDFPAKSLAELDTLIWQVYGK